MHRPTWHETLQTELHRQGLPSCVVARLLDEFADHCDDLSRERGEEQSMEAMEQVDARLGHPSVLVRMAVAEHRRSSFVGRHPIWWCVVAPIPLAVLLLVGVTLAAIGLQEGLAWLLGDSFALEGKTLDELPAWVVPMSHGFVQFLRFVPTLLAAAVICRISRRAGLAWRWPLVGCALVALLASAFRVDLRLPDTPGSGNLSLGLGLPMGWGGLLQALVPLGLGVVAWFWSRHTARRAAAA